MIALSGLILICDGDRVLLVCFEAGKDDHIAELASREHWRS